MESKKDYLKKYYKENKERLNAYFRLSYQKQKAAGDPRYIKRLERQRNYQRDYRLRMKALAKKMEEQIES